MLGLDLKFDVTNYLNYNTCIHNTSLPVSWKTDNAPLKDQFIVDVWRNGLPFIVGTKTHAVGKIQSS
jgi:hypothetical protein